jgi:hypothetical protein
MNPFPHTGIVWFMVRGDFLGNDKEPIPYKETGSSISGDGFVPLLYQQQADNKGQNRTYDYSRIIVLTDPLWFPLGIFLHPKIQPALRIFLRFDAIGKMDHQGESDKAGEEQGNARQAEEEIKAQQESQQDEHLQDLVPLGLQGMASEEIEVILDFIAQFTHVYRPSFLIMAVAATAVPLADWHYPW